MMKKKVMNTYLEQTRKLKDHIEEGFLNLGERLLRIREEELWKGDSSSFVEYLWTLDMTESSASKLIGVYEKCILEWGIDPKTILACGGWTIAYKIKHLAKDKESAERLFNKVPDMLPQHREQTFLEERSGKPMDECDHEWYHVRICKKCQLKEKTYKE